jgi:SAM-dependent methyltransferase
VSDAQVDPVLASVVAYSNDPQGYAQKYQHHRLELPHRFSSSLKRNARVLDLGCGPGRDLDVFANDGHVVTGVELNEDFVEMAKLRHNVIHTDIREISRLFSDLSFDGIWAQASLVHLSHDEVTSVVADCFQLLKPQGIFYTCVPTTGDSGWKTESDGTRWYTVWPERTFVEVCTNAGFAITDVSDGPYIEVWAQKP